MYFAVFSEEHEKGVDTEGASHDNNIIIRLVPGFFLSQQT